MTSARFDDPDQRAHLACLALALENSIAALRILLDLVAACAPCARRVRHELETGAMPVAQARSLLGCLAHVVADARHVLTPHREAQRRVFGRPERWLDEGGAAIDDATREIEAALHALGDRPVRSDAPGRPPALN